MSTQLRDFLNMEANDELHMFIKGVKKKTAKMTYDAFVKAALPKFNELLKDFLKQEVEPQFKAAVTLEKLNGLQIPALPQHIKEEIINLVDKQKLLSLVEKTYICLDLLRAVTSQLGSTVGHMAMHYGRALQLAPKIVGHDGKSL